MFRGIILIALIAAVSAQNSITFNKCFEFYRGKSAYGGPWEETPARHVNVKSDEYPFLATVGAVDEDGDFTYRCAGVLIDPRYVLCPAKCVRSKSLEGKSIVVYLGKTDISNPATLGDGIAAKRIIVHPGYKKPQIYNRLALIKLKKKASVTPACLWNQDTSFAKHTLLAYDKKTRKLYKTSVSAVSDDDCAESLNVSQNRIPNGITDSLYCLQEETQRDCQSYLGPDVAKRNEGPFNVPYVFGIPNTGKGCGQEPTLFSNIPEYTEWIESEIWSS